MLTFKKVAGTSSYRVYKDDVLVGMVKKEELWVVRGTRIVWNAYKKGRYLGDGDTRKGAAQWLS